MPEKTNYQHFNVIKTWNDKVKVTSPVIKGSSDKAYIFQVLLNKRPEITELMMTVHSGVIDIKFKPESLPLQSLLTAMDAILLNVAKKSQNFEHKQLAGEPKQVGLLVEGMSCPACALLIEMTLKKDTQIVDVNANLDAKRVKVFGTRSRQEIVEMIEKLGYSHIDEAQ